MTKQNAVRSPLWQFRYADQKGSSDRKPEGKQVVVEIAAPKPPYKVRRVKTRKLDPKMVRGFIKEHCSLITTVDKDKIPGIERRVKRIYEGTSTPETLTRYLETECDLDPYQAERIVRDQMQKYESRRRLESFRKAGVKMVRWVHGGSAEPRPYHERDYPQGLNGMVFDINHPPVIDPKTGERGYPGELIGCKCRLEAVD